MTPFTKIGPNYFLKTGLHQSILPSEDNPYLTNECDFAHFGNENVHYIHCLSKGKSISDFLDDYNRREILERLKTKILAHYRSVSAIRMPAEFAYKFIPASLNEEFNGELLDAMLHAFGRISKPLDYTHLRYAWLVAQAISRVPLRHDGQIKVIKYNAFPPNGQGRYGLLDGSFKILTCTKEERKKIEPISSDYVLVEFDYNAFEIRTLVALCGLKQPPGDLYNLLHNENSSLTRAEFKQHLISSLYSNRVERTVLHSIIEKTKLKQRFPLEDGKLVNPFGRQLESDPYHYYSRLLQSSAAYILFQQLYRLVSYLQMFGLKSFVSFCIHDSVCMHIHKSELHMINTFEEILSDVSIEQLNYADKFTMKTKLGETYEKMEVIKL